METGAFRIRVPGKWVLAGEHAVVRGGVAVALPHPEYSLDFRFEPEGASQLRVEPLRLELPMRELLETARKLLPELQLPAFGSLKIESTIPAGAGLGSSAALCVSVARWLESRGQLAGDRIFEFARSLEDQFHGRSSGMDVAAVLQARPIRFTRGEGAEPLPLDGGIPKFTFHDLGLRARTKDCVERVEAQLVSDPERGSQLDEEMEAAARGCIEGLRLYSGGQRASGLVKLARSMTQAQGCFEGWGLVPAEAGELIRKLRSQGALAVKMTGAGGGGFLVALWPEF